MQMQSRNDYLSFDAKRFGCPPWNGSRGIPFERFRHDFVIYLGSIEIKDAVDEFTLDDELLGKTEGGHAAGAPAAPTAAADRRRKMKRNKRTYNLVLMHITDESMKTTIRTESGEDAATAWLSSLDPQRWPVV